MKETRWIIDRRAFTMTELVAKLSELHDIAPNKSFRRQVALALRRGLDYGILVKSRNKYRCACAHKRRDL